MSPASLLQNGDFESGGNGTGFQVPGPYNFLTVLSGNSNAGDVAVTANPQAMNTGFFFSSSDHSGTGKMLVVDGITTGGQQRFWKAGSSGGGVGPLTPGTTYRFSYWVKNISTTSNSAATSADIGVAWNNAGSTTLVSGSTQVPFPGGTTASWVQVVYSFIANSAYVNIELYNDNTNPVGNDFAIDDVEVLAPPRPLTLGYSLVDPICPGTSSGLIAAYAAGGTAPYSFSLNGGATNTTGIFTGLAASTGNFLTVTDAATPVNSVTTLPTIILTDPPGLTVRNDTTICAGSSVGLSASGGTGYTWTASPTDPTLTNPFSATPTVSPAVTTVYTVKSSTNRQVNFIFNGDFSQGNLGFATDYNYFVQNTANLQTAYGIVTNANNFEVGFSSACVDHTGGGNMMVVDGALTSNLRVWEQTIPVLPATNYTFSYWIQTVALNNPAQIKTLINGLPITGNATTSSANAPGTLCNWIQYTYPWNSGANTTAKITLINNILQSNGNDFALDDISMVTTITCPNIQKNVTITVTGSTSPVTSFSYSSPVCANATVNPAPVPAAGFAPGGTYSATPAGLSINPSSGVINLSASSPGSYTVTYSVVSSGCVTAGSSTASITISNNITAVTGFSYSPSLCTNGTAVLPVPVSGFTNGGTYTATPAGLTIDATTGQITPGTSTAGIYVVRYTVASSGCVTGGSSTFNVNVSASGLPVTGFSYASPVCSNATVNPAPVSAAGFTTGGTYSATPAGLSINPSTGIINLSASAMGIYTVTYSVAASGCIVAGSSSASITISNTINALTDFSYTTPLCLNQVNVDPMPILSPGFTTGGTFSASPAGLVFMSTATGQVNIQATAPGNYTITYTVPTNGCVLGGSSSAPLVITAGSNAVTGFSYSSPVCQSSPDPAPIPAAGFTGGGTYSSTAGLSINASTGVINLSASTAGTYTVTYSVAASGCVSAGSSTASISITAGGNAVTGFAYNLPVCSNNPGNSTPVPAAGFTNGGTYTASPAGLSINASTGVVNVPGSLVGSYTVTYTVATSGCIAGGSSTAPFNIVTSGNPVTSFSYSPNTVCQAAANPAPVKASGFTNGGAFSSSSGLSIDASTGVIDLLTSTPGTYTVQYRVAASGCAVAGSGIAAITIRPNDNPVTGFSYSTPVCITGTNPQPILSTGFTTGGTFSGLGGLSVNSSTGVINLSASTPGTYTINYNIAPTGCFNGGSGQASILIDPNTAVVTSFSYVTPVCASDTNPKPIPGAGFTTGGIYSSTPGLSVDPATGTINLPTTTAGNYLVSYTVPANACVLSNTGTASIVVNGVPAPPAVINAERCGAGRIILRANGSGRLSWYADSTLTTQVASGNVLDTFLIQTTTFRVTDSNVNCPSTSTPVIGTINPLPPKPMLGNDTALCNGQSILLNAGNYDEYIWHDNSTAATYPVNKSGLYSVRVRSGGVCYSSDTIAVNVLNNCDDINFPSAFSPNGDGRNDLFGALGNVFLIEEYSLLVFNRYGEKVFGTSNPYQRWNGQAFGKLLDPGNYVYVAVYSYRGNKRTQRGSLLLMR